MNVDERVVKNRVIRLLREFDVPYKHVEVIDLRPYRKRYMVRVFSRIRSERRKEKVEKLIEQKLPEDVSFFVY